MIDTIAAIVFRLPISFRSKSSSSFASARRRDVFGAYRIAFGRDPESEAVIAARLAEPLLPLLRSVLTSEEFHTRVRDRLLAGGALHGGRFDAVPNGILRRWGALRLPLSATGKARLALAKNWADLFIALFADPVFVKRVFSGKLADRELAMLRLLEARRRDFGNADLVGEVEFTTLDEVRGWALDRARPDRTLDLQLWIGSRLAATTRPAQVRPDLLARFGGNGRFGFAFRCNGGLPGRSGERTDIIDAASGALVASFAIGPDESIQPGIIAHMRQELGALREVLDRMEAKLPALHNAYGYAIEDWQSYFDAYYRNPTGSDELPGIEGGVGVIVAGTSSSAEALGAALASIAAQHLSPSEVVVVHHGDTGKLAFEAEIERWRERFGHAVSLTLLAADHEAEQGWFQAAVAAVAAPHIVLLPDYARLAPDALARIQAAFETGALFVYADEDKIAAGRDGAPERHAAPLLLGTFDHDLMLQQGLPCHLAGFCRALPLSHPIPAPSFEAVRDDLCLTAYEAGGRAAMAHIPRVLCHVTVRDETSDYVYGERTTAIGEHLRRLGIDAQVLPHSDPCGAVVASAVRIRFPVSEDRSLAIIIPTRDRLDLLRPCIESIQSSLPANRTRVETIIVDNRSGDSETLAYLETVRHLARTRILTHDDGFNWALINNCAAAMAESDVLVFLNNDTTVLSLDCWDELAAQAMRPEVGAVGARLLYGDGTIQHAGIVLDPWHSFASHEGVGLRASDPGYLSRNSLLREVSAVTGACLTTRSEVFRQHGGFDERFPIEGNDTDYCLRLRDRGLRIIYDPFATFYHFESKSRGSNDTPEKRMTADRATALLQARWAGRFEPDPFYNPHFDRLRMPFTHLQPPP